MPLSQRVRRIIQISILSLLLICAACLVWGFLIEPNRLVVNHYTVEIENWPRQASGLRIALIGDVHTDNRFIDEAKLRRIVELTNAEQPDLIVLLGDYIQGGRRENAHRVEPEVTANVLKELRAPLGVFAILGNHDWWYNGPKVRRAFEDVGVPVLENEVTEVHWHGQSIWLVGLADLWTRPQQIEQTIAKAPANATIIALTHNPDVFPSIPSRVPLVLAAHTHGGQVNLPLIGTPVVPSNFGPKYTAGHIYENGHHLFVTTGIGTSIIRVRFRVTPEIAIVTINSKAAAP